MHQLGVIDTKLQSVKKTQTQPKHIHTQIAFNPSFSYGLPVKPLTRPWWIPQGLATLIFTMATEIWRKAIKASNNKPTATFNLLAIYRSNLDLIKDTTQLWKSNCIWFLINQHTIEQRNIHVFMCIKHFRNREKTIFSLGVSTYETEKKLTHFNVGSALM